MSDNTLRTIIQESKGIAITIQQSLVFSIHIHPAAGPTQFGIFVYFRNGALDHIAQLKRKPYPELQDSLVKSFNVHMK